MVEYRGKAEEMRKEWGELRETYNALRESPMSFRDRKTMLSVIAGGLLRYREDKLGKELVEILHEFDRLGRYAEKPEIAEKYGVYIPERARAAVDRLGKFVGKFYERAKPYLRPRETEAMKTSTGKTIIAIILLIALVPSFILTFSSSITGMAIGIGGIQLNLFLGLLVIFILAVLWKISKK